MSKAEKPLVLEILGILLIALLIGVGSAIWVVDSLPTVTMIRDGAWTSNPLAGSTQANMYLRAATARIGLFALNRTEALYYNAFTDEDGEALRPECDYVIEGIDLPARWWSITVYDEEHFLVPNALNRYSFNMNNLRRDAEGRYKIRLSKSHKDADWLPAPGQGAMSLTLRLYNPAPALRENTGAVELPRITRTGCR